MIAEVNGTKINYELNGSGPTLVFIHGIGMSLRQWDEQVKHFSSSFQCLTVDLRGHGLSSPGKITMENFAIDILALLDFLAITKAHFIGFSLGGMVVQEIFRKQRGRFLSMVLSSTACLTAIPERELLLAETLKFVDANTMEVIGPIIASKCCHPEYLCQNPPAYQDFVRMLQQHNKEIYRETLVETAYLDYLELLTEVEVPVLILVGDLDQVCPLSCSQLIARLIPEARLQVFPQTGHLAPLERTKEYNQVLSEFLATGEKKATVSS
ncbi:MAG: alpha/beta hydrolase [Peptococcia bacterium]